MKDFGNDPTPVNEANVIMMINALKKVGLYAEASDYIAIVEAVHRNL